MRPTLADALAEARRRGLDPWGAASFLDGAGFVLSRRTPTAEGWDIDSDAGAAWAEAMLARRAPARNRLIDAIANLYRRAAA